MGVSTPTGSISDVTTTNVLNDNTATATHCHGVVRVEWGPEPSTDVCELMLPAKQWGRAGTTAISSTIDELA
ncbi:hypothetical protein GCM10010324_24570 [Streptomyces hiroshimensis]|uniref:Uncharacterized protein n=1 Tax=Streptomyces hiroshimensis TaxID=66424 RepID=A0ABQ2YDC3_9ACTN|nr:hypothetical protein GCM10010324_24570 [Streptomyces hiroshimensis]